MTVAFTPDMHRRLVLAGLEEHAAIVELVRDAVGVYLERLDRKRRGKGRTS